MNKKKQEEKSKKKEEIKTLNQIREEKKRFFSVLLIETKSNPASTQRKLECASFTELNCVFLFKFKLKKEIERENQINIKINSFRDRVLFIYT